MDQETRTMARTLILIVAIVCATFLACVVLNIQHYERETALRYEMIYGNGR